MNNPIYAMAALETAGGYLKLMGEDRSPAVLTGHAVLNAFDNYESSRSNFFDEKNYYPDGRYSNYTAACGFTIRDTRLSTSLGSIIGEPVQGIVRETLKALYPEHDHRFNSRIDDGYGGYRDRGVTAVNAIQHPYIKAMIGLASTQNVGELRLQARIVALKMVNAPVPVDWNYEAFAYCCDQDLPGNSERLMELKNHYETWRKKLLPDELFPFVLFTSLEEARAQEAIDRHGYAHMRYTFLANYPSLATAFGPEVPDHPAVRTLREAVDQAYNATLLDDIVVEAIGNDLWAMAKVNPQGFLAMTPPKIEDPNDDDFDIQP